MDIKKQVDLGNALFSEGIIATEEQVYNIAKKVNRCCISKEKQEEFLEAARPLINFIANNFHPHTVAVVDVSSAELSEGLCRVIEEEKCTIWRNCQDKYNGCLRDRTSSKCQHQKEEL